MITRAIASFQANRREAQIAVGFVAMLCLLAYTWLHTGNLLGRYINPWQVGYVAAFGIELAVVAMAFRIGELGWTAPDARPFKWTLAGVLGVSVLANLAEGYATRYDGVLVVDAVGRLDLIQGIIGVAATALLSVVVYALAEIVGADVTSVQPSEQAGATESAPAIIYVPATPTPLVAENAAQPADVRASVAVTAPSSAPTSNGHKYACAHCDYTATNQQALAAHSRKHKREMSA